MVVGVVRLKWFSPKIEGSSPRSVHSRHTGFEPEYHAIVANSAVPFPGCPGEFHSDDL
jgi:hypothetical protein